MDFSFKVMCTFCILPCLLANGKAVVVISIMGSDVGLQPMDELCFSTYSWKVCIFKYKPWPLVRNLLNIQLRKQFYCRWNKYFLKTCSRRQPPPPPSYVKSSGEIRDRLIAADMACCHDVHCVSYMIGAPEDRDDRLCTISTLVSPDCR